MCPMPSMIYTHLGPRYAKDKLKASEDRFNFLDSEATTRNMEYEAAAQAAEEVYS